VLEDALAMRVQATIGVVSSCCEYREMTALPHQAETST
jgi:hypothetical protein